MTPYIDKRRKSTPIRPFKAMGHMKHLLADKEDTEQVFYIMEALNGNSAIRKLKAFAKSPKGEAMMARRRNLPEILDDHATLKALPEGSVGRAYVDFMEREGLSAAGLVEESEKMLQHRERYEDDLEFFLRRLRDTHDLYHVLSGYGRDELGEICVLIFSHAQYGGLGNLFIARIGGWDLSRTTSEGPLIRAALSEARKNGKAGQTLMLEDIVSLLAEPLDEARARMNIAKPTAYKKALGTLSQDGYEGRLSAA